MYFYTKKYAKNEKNSYCHFEIEYRTSAINAVKLSGYVLMNFLLQQVLK